MGLTEPAPPPPPLLIMVLLLLALLLLLLLLLPPHRGMLDEVRHGDGVGRLAAWRENMRSQLVIYCFTGLRIDINNGPETSVATAVTLSVVIVSFRACPNWSRSITN